MANSEVELAYQDLYEVIPELREKTMNRNCSSNSSGYGYLYDANLQRNDLVDSVRSILYDSPVPSHNLSEWVKASIMPGEQVNAFDYVQDPSNYQADLQSQLLLYKTPQIPQSRSFDDCSCSSYSSDVPHCTCDTRKPEVLKSSFEPDSMTNFKLSQDNWSNWKEKLHQSLAVPDPSLEYPYYIGNQEISIYDQQDPIQHGLLPNTITENSQALNGFHRVPKSAEPILKPKSSRPRLCHFLLELLADPAKYSGIIEWVDQEKGVFKFLNSSEVASQWGRRRNKPHMKYENFARSLRTYIAKGILTKPRSKLVYRFTSLVY